MIGDTCPLIVGQWGLQCAVCGVCQQHKASADSGIASRVITSAEATSLNRRVMFLTMILLATASLAVTGVTAACSRAHRSQALVPFATLPLLPLNIVRPRGPAIFTLERSPYENLFLDC